MAKLFYKDKQVIGLDIGQTGVKVMAINPKTWDIQGYGSIDLDPEKIIASFDSEDKSYLLDNVKELLSSHLVGSIPSNHVNIGLPTQKSYSRTFNLPIKEQKHLKDAVEVEANQYIPIPTEALYIDYEVIGKKDNSIQVVMSAMPKNIIDTALLVTREAGLRPVMIEPSINAVARVVKAAEEGGNLVTLIVDIGQASTDIAIFDQGAIRVSGSVGVGGNTFTLDIAKKLDTPLDHAHQLKVLHGLNPGSHQARIIDALKPNLQKIAGEIRKIIRYYTERISEDGKIEQVIIVGAGSNVPGVGDYYTNELIMPVRVAIPWQKFDFVDLPQPKKQFRPRYISVAGLASVNYKRIWK